MPKCARNVRTRHPEEELATPFTRLLVKQGTKLSLRHRHGGQTLDRGRVSDTEARDDRKTIDQIVTRIFTPTHQWHQEQGQRAIFPMPKSSCRRRMEVWNDDATCAPRRGVKIVSTRAAYLTDIAKTSLDTAGRKLRQGSRGRRCGKSPAHGVRASVGKGLVDGAGDTTQHPALFARHPPGSRNSPSTALAVTTAKSARPPAADSMLVNGYHFHSRLRPHRKDRGDRRCAVLWQTSLDRYIFEASPRRLRVGELRSRPRR